jgi:hypothetical protein
MTAGSKIDHFLQVITTGGADKRFHTENRCFPCIVRANDLCIQAMNATTISMQIML